MNYHIQKRSRNITKHDYLLTSTCRLRSTRNVTSYKVCVFACNYIHVVISPPALLTLHRTYFLDKTTVDAMSPWRENDVYVFSRVGSGEPE